jgi:hypothetical protein
LESLSGNFARKRDDKKKVEEEDGIKNKTSKATNQRRDCVFIEEERENKISASCALFSKKKNQSARECSHCSPFFFTLKIHAEFNVQVESGRHHIRE